eukprot:NODE_783_length_3906_cov_1.215393.p1 type:complete len:314 gc:universal NODE_783_length_3906_cov_1.215393:3381-2440(-)
MLLFSIIFSFVNAKNETINLSEYIPISKACKQAFQKLELCMAQQDVSKQKFDADVLNKRCTGCSKQYSALKSKCSNDLSNKNIDAFEYDLACHQEDNKFCALEIDQAKTPFDCSNPCHNYAANYLLNAPIIFPDGHINGKNSWAVIDMITCLSDCQRVSFNYFQCVQNAGLVFLQSNPFPKNDAQYTSFLGNVCNNCTNNAADYHSKCSASEPGIGSATDQFCHVESGEFCKSTAFDPATGNAKPFTCTPCSHYVFKNDFLYWRPDVLPETISDYKRYGWTNESYADCDKSLVQGLASTNNPVISFILINFII